MPLISQPRTPFTYTAADLDLTQAPFLGQVRAIYRVVAGSTNFVSFVPGSQFNAFTTLQTGQSYIVDTVSGFSAFQIPDGVQLPDQGAADGASATKYLNQSGIGISYGLDANNNLTPQA